MVGGAGDPDVWPQILSAILDIQIERSSDVAGAALGAAALAAEGAEIAPAISLIRPVDGAIIERSQADVSAYDAIYKSQWANAVGAHG
jgi:sugar (pentulose or hexulose) kinase